MFRLLALLQLTRAALAFTAIADAWTVLLLRADGELPPRHIGLMIGKMLVMAIVSFGLYAFGMTLNDLLDARRDRIFAPRRPIPSGRIQPRWAVVTALVLLMSALLASAFMTPLNLVGRPHFRQPGWQELSFADFVPYSFFFSLGTAALIVFYDATSKYLGGVGLVTLGAIRALHCLVGNPKTPVLFLSMILLTHVVVVSTIAYRLENKRPRLRKRDLAAVIIGLVLGNGGAIAYMIARGSLVASNFTMLIGPGIAILVYLAWAIGIMRTRKLFPRQKGERLMLLGLFWLFVYDATMLASNGQFLASMAITLLFLCAVASFFTIRALNRGTLFTKPTYRAHHTPAPG